MVDGAITSADRDLLLLLALGFALLMVIQAAVSLARSWVVLLMASHLGLQWSGNVFAHLLRLPACGSSSATWATWCRASAPWARSSTR